MAFMNNIAFTVHDECSVWIALWLI